MYRQLFILYYLVLLIYLLQCISCAVEIGPEGLSLKAPNLSDEESHSNFMPRHLKCDACRIIAIKLYEKFDKYSASRSHRNLVESEILDLTESVCESPDQFDSYGIKSIDGVNRLSGPGLETEDVPALMGGGGKWPGRMMAMCENYCGEIGELEIYDAYRSNHGNQKLFEKFLCYGDGVRGECSNIKTEL